MIRTLKHPSLKSVCYDEATTLDYPPANLFTFSGFTTDLSAYTELANFWLTFFILSVIALVIILLILIFLRKRFAINTDHLFYRRRANLVFLQNSDRHRADRGGLYRRGRHHVHTLLPCHPVPPAARRNCLLRRRRHVSGFIWGTQIRFAGRPWRRQLSKGKRYSTDEKVDSRVPKAALLRFLISAGIDVTCKAANGTYYVPSDDQTATEFPNCECMFLSYGVTNYVIYMHVSMQLSVYENRNLIQKH